MPVAEPSPAVVRERLAAAGCVAPDEEAAAFLAAAPDRVTLEQWLVRREQGEPPAWITGAVVFCGRAVRVDRGVYVPRAQSEELARRAAARLADHGPVAPGRALDLCTGAGAIAAHLQAEVPGASVVGVDLDERAAACARRNGVPTMVGDLAGAVRPGPRFTVVTAVAPYVPTPELYLLPADVQRHEPRWALDGGSDGLDLVRRVVDVAAGLLVPGGWLLVEVGGDQDDGLDRPLRDAGFDRVEAWHDDDGDLRGIAARALGRRIEPDG